MVNQYNYYEEEGRGSVLADLLLALTVLLCLVMMAPGTGGNHSSELTDCLCVLRGLWQHR